MILYADAGGASHGDIWIGVADHTGDLIDADLMRDTLINLAELGAVLLACDYAQIGVEGVILTDSMTAVKMIGLDKGLHRDLHPRGLHVRASRVEEHVALRDAILRKLPGGWRVAWIPRNFNLADAALEERIAEVAGI